MSNAVSNAPKGQSNTYQPLRETVESIVVAFILAFLFRAFVAEAFVIPTGSMAPTLMGAHRDLTCEQSGAPYQVGASVEYDKNQNRTGLHVVGSASPSRHVLNPINLQDANQRTFAGDRILVSKFDYILSKPKRWDVIVFKFPEESRMNFIKRLIGLPGEDVLLREGDIYTKNHIETEWSIARKPPDKILAMRQPVDDTQYGVPALVKQNYPSLWQPWSEDGSPTGWSVEQTDSGWSAKLEPNATESWIRYYHKTIKPETWLAIEQNKPLPPVDPTSSELITDFLAYNSTIALELNRQPTESLSVEQLVPMGEGLFEINGLHWVGDLIGEFDVSIQSDSGELTVQLVEFGIEYNVTFDLASGQATLKAFDASAAERIPLENYFNGQTHVTASTKVRGGSKHQIRVANVDDQIVLWVDGRVVEFDKPAEFDSRTARGETQRRPYWLPNRPLDAAPVAIGGRNAVLTVNRASVYRDLYYIAYSNQFIRDMGVVTEFDVPDSDIFRGAAPGENFSGLNRWQIVHQVYSHPEWWEKTGLFSFRQRNTYHLGDGQYMPLGDNSAQSSDARMWREHYVDERYLLGRALLVFWPHTWNRPIPLIPNFSRMGLIR